MTQIDQFESVFRSADKSRFAYKPIEIGHVLVITDLDDYQSKLYSDRIRSFLKSLGKQPDIQWSVASEKECENVGTLLDVVEAKRPDLICTYRNLHSGGWRWPYSLGEHLDVLTQVTTTPVLVLPRPDEKSFSPSTVDTSSVLAITDHLTGDHQLINYAIRFTEQDGTLHLAHIEQKKIFDRYIDAISKIGSIDTEHAKEEILKRLLKEPEDYIASCIDVIKEANIDIEVNSIVKIGSQLEDYRQLINENNVDILVVNTKDDDQMAMHGLAYPLAIELRQYSLLML